MVEERCALGHGLGTQRTQVATKLRPGWRLGLDGDSNLGPLGQVHRRFRLQYAVLVDRLHGDDAHALIVRFPSRFDEGGSSQPSIAAARVCTPGRWSYWPSPAWS